MKNELVSVIVPVYNVEKYLVQCVDSILNQTYKNIEIILVDDGSTDSSGEICDRYAGSNNNIQCIHKKNQGLGMARNSGIEAASGEYIVFVDSDDYLGENHIANLYAGICSSEADTCIGGFTRDSDGKRTVNTNVLAGNTYKGKCIVKEIIPLMCGKLKPGDN